MYTVKFSTYCFVKREGEFWVGLALIKDEQAGDAISFDYTLPLEASSSPEEAEMGVIYELAASAPLVMPLVPNIHIMWYVSSPAVKELIEATPAVLFRLEKVGSYSIELMEESIRIKALQEINQNDTNKSSEASS